MNARLSLNQTYEMLNWLNRHRQQLNAYQNEYIAYSAQKLIARSPDLDKVLAVAQVAKKPFAIYFVSPQIASMEILPLGLKAASAKQWLPNYPAILSHKQQRIAATIAVGSGADLTAVSKQVGQDLGYRLVKGEQMLLAEGSEDTVEYVLRAATLSVGGHTFQVPVAWLQQDIGVEQVLLGKEIVLARFQEGVSEQQKKQTATVRKPEQTVNPVPKVAAQTEVVDAARMPQNVSPPSTPVAIEKSSPKSKSDREQPSKLESLTKFIRSTTSLIWAVVILIVIIPLLGKILLTNLNAAQVAKPSISTNSTIVVRPSPNLSKVDVAVVDAIKQAEWSAEAFASKELDVWESELASRVDNFLDWYFGYFNQKKIEFSTPFAWLSSAVFHKFNPSHPSPSQAVAENLTEDFQREFAKRVLLPKNAQIRLEVLTTETINLYISELGNNVTKVRSKYKIPQGNWDRYLSDISTTIHDTEGNISTLSLKMLAGGGGYLMAKPLVLGFAGKVGSKVSGKLAGKAAAKVAAKTGGAVGAELGASLIDPIVGIGILVWDIWDYAHTVDIERPILQQNILDYLQDVKRSLLSNPENGVMAAVYQLEGGILKSLPAAKSPTLR